MKTKEELEDKIAEVETKVGKLLDTSTVRDQDDASLHLYLVEVSKTKGHLEALIWALEGIEFR